MTMQPQVWTPSPGYHAAALREQSEAKALGAFYDAADEYWQGFWRDCDALMVLEYPTPVPEQRLMRYNQKPVQELPPVPDALGMDEKGKPVLIPQPQPLPTGSWLGQKLDFPQDYADDIADWIKLEPVSLRRDQVLREIAGIEMQMAAEQAMGAPPPLEQPAPTSGVTQPLPDISWTGAPKG